MSSASLLRAAASALDNGRDPFSGDWLREHDVSLDACLSLGEQLAIGARIVAAGIEQPKSIQGQAMLMTMASEL